MFTYSRGYPRWLPYDLYTTIFQHFKCIIINIHIFWMLKWHINAHVSEMHTYFMLITCPLTKQHYGSRSVWFFYVDVICISKEIKLHSKFNVIKVAAMSKLLVTDFLLIGLPLLYLSRFEPHSDCLWESHVVLADGEVVPYGELPLLFHLPAGHDSREWNNLDDMP